MRSSRLIATAQDTSKDCQSANAGHSRVQRSDAAIGTRETKFSGGHTGGATPDPISNSEVKTSRADGTAGETLWESRSPPGIIPSPEPTILIVGSGLFYCPSSGPAKDSRVDPPAARVRAQQSLAEIARWEPLDAFPSTRASPRHSRTGIECSHSATGRIARS